eukprot:CAMPEP_0113645914 /NCGR_PEP_ID=MMETSP0017_2-20120614/24222_1 /TAXON_ID=2856 /ORGANISM="Cylindrotheca closterium" /LENGTH=335 /DNA_ID=CAMNT_0000557717 /DNA_START=147 /DNA_END=1154 /DNA_ORIENTATION=- /assembly_acc=CAM_ASM_000147
MTTRRPAETTTKGPRKTFSKSPGRSQRVLNPRNRTHAVSPGRAAKSPLILPPPTPPPPSGEVASGDDWSQYSGDQQSEVECLHKLKEYCKLFQIPASDSLIFRFACFYDFDYEETRKALKKDYNNPYLTFEMDDAMVEQFQTAILFPLPKMRTKKQKSQVIYARPARYARTSPEAFDELLKQLCFLLNDLSRTAQQCRHGVSLLINLKGYSRKNVDVENSIRLVQLIQSHLVPTKIEMVVFVDTTTMSSKIWQQSISPLLSPEEEKKICFTKHDDLYRYLMPSYEKFLPDEIAEGWRNSTDLIESYLDRIKVRIEKEKQEKQELEEQQQEEQQDQ